jgi:hypothetical protein
MREWNQIESVIRPAGPKLSADHLLQFLAFNELTNCQSADRNDQTRFQNLDFFIQPGRTIANFVRRRDPIRAAWGFTWKTSADRREINLRADNGFVHPAKILEPAKKSPTRGVRKRPFQRWLARTRCLSNYHHLANDRAAGHRG